MYGGSATDRSVFEKFFQNVFSFESGVGAKVKYDEMCVVQKGWVSTPHDLLYFSGCVHSAFSKWGQSLVSKHLSS